MRQLFTSHDDEIEATASDVQATLITALTNRRLRYYYLKETNHFIDEVFGTVKEKIPDGPNVYDRQCVYMCMDNIMTVRQLRRMSG